jgi:hypothetical protein
LAGLGRHLQPPTRGHREPAPVRHDWRPRRDNATRDRAPTAARHLRLHRLRRDPSMHDAPRVRRRRASRRTTNAEQSRPSAPRARARDRTATRRPIRARACSSRPVTLVRRAGGQRRQPDAPGARAATAGASTRPTARPRSSMPEPSFSRPSGCQLSNLRSGARAREARPPPAPPRAILLPRATRTTRSRGPGARRPVATHRPTPPWERRPSEEHAVRRRSPTSVAGAVASRGLGQGPPHGGLAPGFSRTRRVPRMHGLPLPRIGLRPSPVARSAPGGLRGSGCAGVRGGRRPRGG